MARIAILIFFICSLSAQAQTYIGTAENGETITITVPEKYDWQRGMKKAIAPASLSFAAGFLGAIPQGLLFRKTEFFRAFPKAKRQYWDRDISWENKKFLGGARDGYHDFYRLHNLCLIGTGISATIPICKPGKIKYKILDIAIQSVAVSLGYAAGSTLMFNGILHK